MALTDAERAEIDTLKKKVDDLPGEVTAALAKALGGSVADEAEPTPESVAKAIKDLPAATDPEYAERLAKVEADIKKLAEGDSSQTEDGTEPVTKQDAEQVRKAFETEGVSPTLVGVL